MMVAYSFNKIFVPQVVAGLKCQTVRAHRRRHARPGEAVQLYTAMRTRFCRKLIDPDPICVGVDEIRIVVSDCYTFGKPSGCVDTIEINGRELSTNGIEFFAILDGFKPDRILGNPPTGHVYKPDLTARSLMGRFWHAMHGVGAWQGVVVHWAAR